MQAWLGVNARDDNLRPRQTSNTNFGKTEGKQSRCSGGREGGKGKQEGRHGGKGTCNEEEGRGGVSGGGSMSRKGRAGRNTGR